MLNNNDKFPVIDVSNWKELDIPASGVRKKLWLQNPHTGEIVLFKYPKASYTGDYWAEKLAYELSKPLGIDVCQASLASYNKQIGSISFKNLGHNEYMEEGNQILGASLNFSTSSDIYSELVLVYSIELIEDVLQGDFVKFLPVIIFDCLIGNSDRHHGNWAFVVNEEGDRLKLYPLYDNGSSLCYLENETRLEKMRTDMMMLEAAIYSKARSSIGIRGKNSVNHFELFSYVNSNYHREIQNWMDNLEHKLSYECIKTALNRFDSGIISDNLKNVLYAFLTRRRDKMIDLYNTEVRKVGVF